MTTVRIDGIDYATVRIPSAFGYTIHLVPVPDDAWLPEVPKGRPHIKPE